MRIIFLLFTSLLFPLAACQSMQLAPVASEFDPVKVMFSKIS